MPAATGSRAAPLYALRTAISKLAWFQSWTGSGDASAALAHIVVGEVDAERETLPDRPFLLMRILEGSHTRQQVAVDSYLPGGEIEIYAEAAIAAGDVDDQANAHLQREQEFGELVDQLSGLSGEVVDATRLWLGDLRSVLDPTWLPRAENVPPARFSAWAAAVTVGYGMRG